MDSTDLVMRPAFILLFSFFFFACILTGCSGPIEETFGYQHQDGISVPDSGVVTVNNKMVFYWNRLLEPSDFEREPKPLASDTVPFPDTWNGFEIDGEPLTGKGHATYRSWFRVDSVRSMAIKIKDYCNAFKLWINGELIAQGGIPATSEIDNHGEKINLIESFVPVQGRNELIIQTANYEEKYGGFRQPILMGSESEVRALANREKVVDGFVLGLILMMALYHLVLFGLNRENRAFLWFGLLAFFIASRFWLLSDINFLQPWFQAHLYLKLAIVSALMTSVMLYFFFHSVFPEWLDVKIRNLYGGIVLVLALLSFVFPIYSVSVGIHYIQIIVFTGLFYIFYLTLRSLFSVSRYKWMKAAGVLLFLFSVAWEGMIFNRAVYAEYTLHYGLLGFIFFQSFALSYDFSRASRRNEQLNRALEEHNKNLQKKVEEKSRELVEIKERELLSVTMQKSSTEKLLKKIEEKLIQVSAKPGGGPPGLDELFRMIRKTRNSGENDKVLMHFEKVYPGFFEVLTELHPVLNQREIKLCAYLRMNLDHKEIADILHVAPESVRKAKTRMRKKMGLRSDKNINDYLMRI